MSPIQKTFASTCRWLLLFAVCASVVGLASAQTVAPVAPERVTMSLDKDLIAFVQAAAWVAGIFLATFAFIAVGFFGWDVAQTRKAMQEARDDLNKRMGEIRLDHQALKELKERLEKLGAELVEQIEEKKAPSVDPRTPLPPPAPQPSDGPADPIEDGPIARVWEADDEKRDRIRYVISWGEFEWTTLPTLAKKTGLSEREAVALAASDPLVQVGTGRHGQLLFRLREFNHDPMSKDTKERDRWPDAVMRNAQTGKLTVRKDG